MAVETKRLSELPLHEPLLVGRVSIVQASPEERPRLEVSVWCPHCKIGHTHPWIDPEYQADAAIQVTARCVHSQWASRGYWIGLDPMQREGNGRVYRAMKALMRTWEQSR
jgi:hypothetical protein